MVLGQAAFKLALAPTLIPALGPGLIAQVLLFAALAVVADLKQLKLESANHSVATATNFACAVILGPAAAVCVGALGALAGDVATRKPLHKTLFNGAALALSVASGSAAMSLLRNHGSAVTTADLPAFVAYTLVNGLVNQIIVCTVIALAGRKSLWRVWTANYKGMAVPLVALYPLGVLMAVVYGAFGGWIGLSLLVMPVIAAYAALDNARALRVAFAELRITSAHKEELLGALKGAHSELTLTHEQLKATQAQVMEQERLRALGQMASGIAHDFNNALAPVVGFSELLLLQPEQWSDEAYMHQYLGLINTAARDASQVVRQLREFYRKPEEQEMLLPLDLNGLVQQVKEITSPRWRDQAQAAGVTLSVVTDLTPVPPVAGDEAALREVLTNLMFNAVDAMPHGGTIQLRTRVMPGAPAQDEGPWVAIEVVDGGTGMTEEVRARCLDPFFTTKGSRGTGMGLSMAHGIVSRHGGALEIDSAWGHGTTMRIRLPGCASQQPAVSTIPDEGESSASPTATERRLGVLVVDDEPSVRQVVSAYLASYGCVADTACDGVEALRLFRSAPYDVVITDRAMPDMNGDSLARAVKQLSPSTPVIMLTGFGDMLHALDERPADVDLVLSKPILHADLRAALNQVTSLTSLATLSPAASTKPVGTPAVPGAPGAPAVTTMLPVTIPITVTPPTRATPEVTACLS
jgi:signal transduction histidine kinase/ActR/RegA family two-component response regulator